MRIYLELVMITPQMLFKDNIFLVAFFLGLPTFSKQLNLSVWTISNKIHSPFGRGPRPTICSTIKHMWVTPPVKLSEPNKSLHCSTPWTWTWLSEKGKKEKTRTWHLCWCRWCTQFHPSMDFGRWSCLFWSASIRDSSSGNGTWPIKPDLSVSRPVGFKKKKERKKNIS